MDQFGVRRELHGKYVKRKDEQDSEEKFPHFKERCSEQIWALSCFHAQNLMLGSGDWMP